MTRVTFTDGLICCATSRIVAGVVAAAVACIGCAMGVVAWWSMRLRLRANEWYGVAALAAVGCAGIAAFAGTLLLDGPFVALGVCSSASLLGFALAARFHGAGGDDPSGGSSDDEPPWWPTFESDLRRYERQRVNS